MLQQIQSVIIATLSWIVNGNIPERTFPKKITVKRGKFESWLFAVAGIAGDPCRSVGAVL
jgi:hypothetical protein